MSRGPSLDSPEWECWGHRGMGEEQPGFGRPTFLRRAFRRIIVEYFRTWWSIIQQITEAVYVRQGECATIGTGCRYAGSNGYQPWKDPRLLRTLSRRDALLYFGGEDPAVSQRPGLFFSLPGNRRKKNPPRGRVLSEYVANCVRYAAGVKQLNVPRERA